MYETITPMVYEHGAMDPLAALFEGLSSDYELNLRALILIAMGFITLRHI